MGGGGGESDDSQSLYAGDDGVERGLDVGRGAGADDRQVLVLQHVGEKLGEEKKLKLKKNTRK